MPNMPNMSNMLKKIPLLMLTSFSLVASASACSPQEGGKPAEARGKLEKGAKPTGTTKAQKAGKGTLSKVKAAQAKANQEMAAHTKAALQEREGGKTESEREQADPIEEIRAFIAEKNVDKAKPDWRQSLAKPPKLTFPPEKKYFWNMETSEGPIKIEFMTKVAPMHVSSTIYLTELGYYDGLTFHRVIKGFMAQGGCPLGKGYGDPGYTYDGEFDAKVRHDRPGLLSMANRNPQPQTDGSQFFITFSPQPGLNGKHTIFGEVVEGMPVVKALDANGGSAPQGTPKKNLWIKKATITVEDVPAVEMPETPKAE